MRALLILSVVVLSFFLLKWWSPGTSEAAPLEPIPESEPAQARFLAPPPSAQSPVTETTATSPSPEPVQQEQERRSDWPEPEAGGEQSELAAAAALVHGTPADVQVASAGLAPDRARLVEAFAWMLAGERQLAVSLSTKISKDEVPGREGALFEAALTGKAAEPASSMEGPLARAMEMALLSREAGESLRAGEPAEAARQYSRLLVGELEAPWTADPGVLAAWTLGLDEAQRHHRWDPRGEWPGVEMEVQPGDSMITVRKRFLADHPGAVLCTGLIERANDVKGFLQPGQKLRVPTDTARILVDLEARWALFFLGDEVAGSWPVGIGPPGGRDSSRRLRRQGQDREPPVDEGRAGGHSLRRPAESPGNSVDRVVAGRSEDLLRIPRHPGAGEHREGGVGRVRALPERRHRGAVPDPSGGGRHPGAGLTGPAPDRGKRP
jgi:hypothetical protein